MLWFCVTIVTFSNTSCIYVPIYLLWLHWVFVAGHRFSLVVKIRGYCLIVVHGASHCSGFCCCWSWALDGQASVVVACGFSIFSCLALEHRLNSCMCIFKVGDSINAFKNILGICSLIITKNITISNPITKHFLNRVRGLQWRILYPLKCVLKASLMAHTVKNLPAMQEAQVLSLNQKIPWTREWLPTLVFLLGTILSSYDKTSPFRPLSGTYL